MATFTLELSPRQPGAVDAVIDYRVYYVGATGVEAPKVFKLTRRRLRPGIPMIITRPPLRARIDPSHTAGTHVIDVQVNGRVLGSTTIEVTPAA